MGEIHKNSEEVRSSLRKRRKRERGKAFDLGKHSQNITRVVITWLVVALSQFNEPWQEPKRALPFQGFAAFSADGFGHEDIVAGNFGGHVRSERGGAGFNVTEVAIKGRERRARADDTKVDHITTSFAEEILGGIH